MNTSTSLISTIFTAECVAGNTFDKGILMFDALLSAIPQERIESVLKEVIDLTDIDLVELKSQLENLTIDSKFPCSTAIDNSDIVVNELLKDIHLNKLPYAGVKSFLLTVEEHQTSKFLNRVDITALSEYMFSLANFGDELNVNQTGSLTSEIDGMDLRADKVVYWDDNSEEEGCDDLTGSFTIYLSRDGLSCAAGANGNDVNILNHDDVITSTAKKFNIPQSLLSRA